MSKAFNKENYYQKAFWRSRLFSLYVNITLYYCQKFMAFINSTLPVAPRPQKIKPRFGNSHLKFGTFSLLNRLNNFSFQVFHVVWKKVGFLSLLIFRHPLLSIKKSSTEQYFHTTRHDFYHQGFLHSLPQHLPAPYLQQQLLQGT